MKKKVEMHEQIPNNYNQERFYSVHGRIGRIRFLAYNLLLNIMLIPLVLIAGGLLEISSYLFSDDSKITDALSFLIVILAFLVYLYILLIPSKRRLNDLNISGLVSLLWFIPVVNLILLLCLAFVKGDINVNDYGTPSEPPSLLTKIIAVLMPIIAIFMIIFIFLSASIAMHAYQLDFF